MVNEEGVFVKLSTKAGAQNEFESDFYYTKETQQTIRQELHDDIQLSKQ